MAETSGENALYILDAHGLIFQMYHGIGPMSAPDGRPTNAVFGVTRSLMSLYDRGAGYLIAALDRAEPTFREKLDAEYKAHRDPPPDDLLIQEPMIHQVLEAMRIPFLSAASFEADDVMATLATEGEARGLKVFLCSSDKDLRQLLSPNIRIMNLRKGEEMDADGLMKDWGVRPEQVIDFQALVGDSVDHVPGVPGVGPKTASKWLAEYGTLDNLIAHADEVGGAKVKAALKEAIANGRLALSKQLVSLDRRVPIEFDWEGWKRRDWDGQRLLELFQSFGFRGFAERVRATLRNIGASKNAAMLGEIGAIPGNSAESAAPSRSRASRKRAPGSPSLFDVINETAPDSEAPTPPPPDNWSYAGYRLIDTPEEFERFLTELKEQKRITFDLETTSIDPLRASIVGYAFCWKRTEAYYLPVLCPTEDRALNPANTLASLKPIFESENILKVNQNIKYELLVLRKHGITLRGIAGDPMIAHYLLNAGSRTHNLDDLTRAELGHENIPISQLIGKGKTQLRMNQVRTEKVRDYACEDADTAFQLGEKLEAQLAESGVKSLYEEIELPLVSVLAEMEFNGVRLDKPFLKKLSAEMAVEIERIEAEAMVLAGKTVNISSPKQLREVLYDEMRLPIGKRTGTTGEPSTDQESLERLAALGHEFPKKIIEHRQIAKLKGTYVDALPELVNPETDRVHTSFNQTVAATGRLSSSDPNLQNVPARTEQGRQIRQAFIPREGWKILTADYSQVELRLLAHFCGDDAMRAAFLEDRDVHSRVAAQIFNIPEEQVSSDQRRAAKTVNFGVIYGISAFGLAIRLGIGRGEAQKFIEDYFSRFPKVLAYQDQLLENAQRNGYVSTILGRRRKFTLADRDVKSGYRNRTQAAREAINMEIQGSAADLMKIAMLKVYQRLQTEAYAAKMLLTVHDELVFEVEPADGNRVATMVREEMAASMNLTVPLKVDIAIGENWLDVEDIH